MQEPGADHRYGPEEEESKQVAPTPVSVGMLSHGVKERRQDGACTEGYHDPCRRSVSERCCAPYERQACHQAKDREEEDCCFHLL
ncbi:hypothetical protein SDC9_194337 [bioreactor metagenome]|uniref:Uncharacterized protein n=1 Tax=bioreactor metagenome TaxID=1076179 RepID=A0A645I8L2_9ZZZZ